MKQSLLLVLLCYSLGSSGQSYKVQEYDIASGSTSSRPQSLFSHNNNLYFFATDTTHGEELWTIGSNNSPQLVDNINPGKTSFPKQGTRKHIAAVNGKVYFSSNHINYGEELWMFDGVNKPSLVKDIMMGPTSSSPSYLTALGNKLYFAASDTSTQNGIEIFEYDPASGLITKRSNLLISTSYSGVFDISTFDGRLIFSAYNNLTGSELYVYDPKVKISWLLADIAPGNLDAHPIGYTSLNGKLYFTATDGTKGRQLYLYDGIYTPKRVEALDSLGITLLNSANSIGAYKGKLYFAAKLSSNQYSIYAYTPSDNNIMEIRAGSETFSSPPSYFCVFHDNLFFSAIGSVSGNQVWTYNGQNNARPVTQFTDINSFPAELTVLNDNLFFSAGSANGRELFKISESPISVPSIYFSEISVAYPNPTKDIASLLLNLNNNQTLNISLTDANGKLLYKTDNILYSASKHTIKIPLHNFPAGIYVYSVKSNDGTILNTGKIQKL